MLQFLGFQDLLNQLAGIGFFSYVLPFLLIFAFTYAILGSIPVFKDNRGAAAIIAFAIGLLALQFDFVPVFFAAIFPRFGVGLSVLLVGLILAGIFISGDDKYYKWIFFALGALIFVIITISSLSAYSYGLMGFWDRYGALMIVGTIIIGGILAVILTSRRPSG